MPFVSGGHLWLLAIVLVIVLIIWGPGKLPDVGSGLGRAIREFRKASSETRDEFTRAVHTDPASSASTPTPYREPTNAGDPLAQRDAAAPEVPAPGAPIQPAPLGGGTVPRPPSDSDPR